MADINLKGMGVALITPFKDDESVDYDALSKLVDYQVQNGTDYLVKKKKTRIPATSYNSIFILNFFIQ